MNFLLLPIRYLPAWAIALLSEALGSLAYLLAGKRRRIAVDNVRRALGDGLAGRGIRRIARKSFVHMIRVGIEFFQLPRWKGRLKTIVPGEGSEHLLKVMERGKGAILLGSHLGNWELGAAGPPEMGFVTVMVARLPSNRFMQKITVDVRTEMGVEMVPRKRGMRGVLRALGEGKIVVIALDQHSIDNAVTVEFFGRPAATSVGAALLALKYDTPVIPGLIWREGGHYTYRFLPEVEIERSGDQGRDVQVNTQKFVRILEEYIRQHPEQWLWMHNRWRLD